MAYRDIRIIGDPVLRTECDWITDIDDSVKALVEDLLETVDEDGRAGLAANQIGIGLRAFSWNIDGEIGYILNPKIVEVSKDEYQDGDEGCLSVPGLSLTSIDVESEAQHCAREFFAAAGVRSGRIRLINGRSVDLLPRLAANSYDFVLLDGDPLETPGDAQEALRILRPGGLLVLARALMAGRVADPARREEDVVAIRNLGRELLASPDVEASMVPLGEGLVVATSGVVLAVLTVSGLRTWWPLQRYRRTALSSHWRTQRLSRDTDLLKAAGLVLLPLLFLWGYYASAYGIHPTGPTSRTPATAVGAPTGNTRAGQDQDTGPSRAVAAAPA